MIDVEIFDKEDIVVEIRELVKEVDAIKDEIDVYCDLVKQMFLAKSGRN